ncbi:MAG TPA: hypothetical protein VN549_03250, partial [Negativicutes bacterium]|nr:hypothetical protein [Negativicutes bacterium]
QSMSALFPEDADVLKPVREANLNMPDIPFTFRVRLVIPKEGNKFIFSDWSDTYVYSKTVVDDIDALINHAPKLVSAELDKKSDGMPYLKVYTDRLPGECQYLNAISGGAMSTEVWMRRAGETEFKNIYSTPFQNKIFEIFVGDYFDKAKGSYAAEAYEIRIRYALKDLSSYRQSGRSDIIYSPFSNIYSQTCRHGAMHPSGHLPSLQRLMSLESSPPASRELI